ncbi:MAG: DUF6391 domain-containing protein [Anaerolineales bacterium]|nr:DUF6391 domain-containing protein [Anaerolineales bacterium]
MNILEMEPIARVRRHHAIEHATVTLLTERHPDLRIVGRSDSTGFHIYGEVERNELDDATRRALARLQSGERALAIHPRCGTNLVVAGLLTALAAVIAIGRKPSLDKIPNVILATTVAGFVAQPLGAKFQERVTTSPDVCGARIAGIRETQMGQIKVQHVDIEWA